MNSTSKKIAFVVSRELDLICMQSLIEYYRDHSLHEAKIFVIQFETDPRATQEAKKIMDSHQFQYIGIQHLLKSGGHFDFIFVSNPHFSHMFYILLKDLGSKVIYIPYGHSISKEDYSWKTQYNQLVHQLAWRIYTINDFYKKLYERHCVTKGTNVKVINTTPKFDGALRICKGQPAPDKARIFLWNIHFNIVPDTHGGIDRTWSAYSKYSEAVFKFFLEHPEATLIVRPHPNLQHIIETENNFLAPFEVLPNVKLEVSWRNGYEKAFAVADAMITDLSSMFFDFCVTGKPIVALTYEKSARMNEFAEKMYRQFAYMISNEEQFNEVLAGLLGGEDKMRSRRLKALQNDHIFRLSEPACKIIAEDIGAP